MRVMFMGTTPFSCVVLQQILDDGYEVVAVVTQPDRPFGRKKILKASPIKVLAETCNIPVLQPQKIKEAISDVLAYEPDLVITCAYGQIVPKEILEYPKFLCLNVHASLLPKYRGGAPIHWSIIKGETETGITLMRMDVGMDSGDMLSSRSVPIEANDVMGDVEAKLMQASKFLIHEDLPLYLAGQLKFVPQDKEKVTFAYTIQRDDEFISFNRPVVDVYNHIRGLIPWPGSFGLLDDETVKFHGVVMHQIETHDVPGKIIKVDAEGVWISTLDGVIQITRIQPTGKAAIDSKDFFNGIGRTWEGKTFK